MRTRQNQRKIISLPGRYLTSSGEPVDVLLKDLSTGGCRFDVAAGRLAPGSRLQIHVGSSGPHVATVKWVRAGEAGVTFAEPIAAERFVEFQNCHVHDRGQATISEKFEPMKEVHQHRFC